MGYTEIIYDVADRVATITLNRPERLNAFTGRMMHELIAAFDQADADDDVRVVVVTGAGRGFCAGADLGGGGETFAKGGSDVVDLGGVPRDGGGLVVAAHLRIDQAGHRRDQRCGGRGRASR